MVAKKKTTRKHHEEMASAPQAYMRSVNKFSLLTPEEELELADIIHGDDAEASDRAWKKLTTSNLRLVVKIANQFVGRGVPKHDLIAEGNVGLLTAAKKFRRGKGTRFSTYSAWWIKQAMRRAINSQSRTIRIPVQALEKIHRVTAAAERLKQQLNREPSDREIAEEIGLSVQTVARLRHIALSTQSINALLVQGENNEVGDIIPDPNSPPPDAILSDVELINKLHTLIEQFDERERKILIMRFGLDGEGAMTLEETGLAVGCTRERVRQIQNLALAKLRDMLKKDGF